jgi:UDP-2,3-diacylglucosamine hydrolase
VSEPGGDLVIVGDVHLDRDEPAAPEFVAFLDAVAATASRLVLAGDLFEIWIGRPELEGPHHREVASALSAVRRRGVFVRYLEGNHDYRIGPLHEGGAFDEVSSAGVVERCGDGTLLVVHGDRVDSSDRTYRAWRAVSRSRAVWLLFNALPPRSRLRLADSLRRRLGHGNRSYRGAIPEEAVRGFAAARFREGHGTVVLGHFHVERELEAVPPSPPGRIVVLPEWKGSRRHLRVAPDGRLAFERSTS